MKTFIILPTYNERGNLKPLVKEIFAYLPDCEIIVADDDSPDGTWKVAEEMSRLDARIHLLHRKTDRGRGRAGIAGFYYALEHGADAVFEMDADFSHNPAFLPHFMHAIQDYDVVSGCRFIQGGEDAKRSGWRKFVTFASNVYCRLVLGFKLRDCSSGYRCFRREVLEDLDLASMRSTGPSIVQETLFRAIQLNYRILEIPIVFQNRNEGRTKLSYKHLVDGFLMVLRLRFSKPFRRNTEPPQSAPTPSDS